LLLPSDDASHTYESAFHVDADSVSVDGLNLLTENTKGGNLAILTIGPQGTAVEVVEAQEEPFVQGWMPKNGDITKCLPVPTPVYTFSGVGKLAITYVVVPVAPGAESPMTGIRPLHVRAGNLACSAGVLTMANGKEIYFAQREPGDIRMAVGEGETDSESGALFADRSGRVERISLATGAGIWGDGTQLSPNDSIV
jgi:hypothetical protein